MLVGVALGDTIKLLYESLLFVGMRLSGRLEDPPYSVGVALSVPLYALVGSGGRKRGEDLIMGVT